MTLVNCNLDCKYADDEGICKLDEISLDVMGQCNDYEEEIIYRTDKFYARCKNDKTGEEYWEQRTGTKEVIDGIDFFVRCNLWTHGKTGLGVFNNQKFKEDLKYKEKILNIVKERENECEFSPLYNNSCKLKIYKEGEKHE